MAESEEVTRLLRLARDGDRSAEQKVFQLLYADLRKVAASCLKRERQDHTLQPTALVNEAYIRLVGHLDQDWQGRAHFLAVAAQVMRRVLVDWARARGAGKRGGAMQRVELKDGLVGHPNWSSHMVDLDRALSELAAKDPRAARVVELRYFGGMTDEEIAVVVKVSDRTVTRDWEFARAWLMGVLGRNGSAPATWFRTSAGG
jgi:RNA polymerase sigma-70 factor (ECF subfamily)